MRLKKLFKSNSKFKDGFSLLEIIYGLFFYSLIQFGFLLVMDSEIDIYQNYEVISYDDFDIFSFQLLETSKESNFVSYTPNTITISETGKGIGTYRYRVDNFKNPWLIYSLNGGYQPKVKNVHSLKISHLYKENYLMEIKLANNKNYQLVLPLNEE